MSRWPVTAAIILFELTGEYSIILPLMAAVVMAAGTGYLLSKDTIYTAKLWRRGIDLDAPPSERIEFTAADTAVPAPEPLSARASLDDAAAALATSRFGMLPVVDNDGRYLGCVSARDVAEALDDSSPPDGVEPLVGLPAAVTANAPVDEILAGLSGRGGTGLPVLNDARPHWSGGSPTGSHQTPPRRIDDGDRAVNMDTPPLTGASLFPTWISSPVADLLVALAVLGYVSLLIRLRCNGRRWPALRTVAALAAALLLVLTFTAPSLSTATSCSGCT